jgi:chromosome segregation protein
MPLLELLSGPKGVLELAGKLLAGAWVVESLEDLPDDFDQIAVTPAGRVWFGVSGEVRQLTHGGGERVLAARNERDRLVGACERAAATESRAAKEVDAAAAAVSESEASFGHARERLLEGRRRRDTEVEHRRRVAWTIEQRMSTPAEGPRALERAQIEGELAAERRAAQASERERVRRAQRRAALAARLALDRALVPAAKRLASALEAMAVHAAEHAQALEQTLAADRQEGETMASRLRACAAQEAELQAQLRAAAERLLLSARAIARKSSAASWR